MKVEDSYIVFLKYISEKEARYGYDLTYEIKVVKFDNLGNVLYHNPNVIVAYVKQTDSDKCATIKYFIKNLDECKKLNNIREYLSSRIEKEIEKCEESRNRRDDNND